MPIFTYKASKPTGETETGTLDSPNQDAAINTLQQKGLIVLAVSKREEIAARGKTYKVKLHSKITLKDLVLFSTQLATTLKANIPLLKCLEIQAQQTISRKFKVILDDIKDNVRQGSTLRDSMAKHPRVFGSMWLNLTETGEASGQLPAVLAHMNEYLVARSELKRKTISALIYPALLISVSVFAIYIFTVRVIPIFTGIFKDFNMPLPLITKTVVSVSDFLRKNVLLTFISIGATVFGGLRYIKTEKGRRIFDTLVFRIPVFGSFILNSAIEKFSSSLSILLHSGIPILQALDIVARASDNKIIEEALKNAYIDVRDGKSLSSSLQRNQVFPPLAISMCNVGEETGELDKMLEEVTKYYRGELNVFVERLSATLEPLVIIIMGGVVFILVLAMYLPIFRLALLGEGRS